MKVIELFFTGRAQLQVSRAVQRLSEGGEGFPWWGNLLSINQSINQSIFQPINQSINKSTNQPINQSTRRGSIQGVSNVNVFPSLPTGCCSSIQLLSSILLTGRCLNPNLASSPLPQTAHTLSSHYHSSHYHSSHYHSSHYHSSCWNNLLISSHNHCTALSPPPPLSSLWIDLLIPHFLWSPCPNSLLILCALDLTRSHFQWKNLERQPVTYKTFRMYRVLGEIRKLLVSK